MKQTKIYFKMEKVLGFPTHCEKLVKIGHLTASVKRDRVGVSIV